MIWDCMTFYGCGLLMKINSKVNQALYKEMANLIPLSKCDRAYVSISEKMIEPI